MISADRADKALEYLIGTDKEVAELKGQTQIKDQLCKKAKAKAFNEAKGSSVEMRKAQAEMTTAVAEADKEFNEATVEYETVRNRRITAATIIDMYRTEESSRRAGTI